MKIVIETYTRREISHKLCRAIRDSMSLRGVEAYVGPNGSYVEIIYPEPDHNYVLGFVEGFYRGLEQKEDD